MTEETRHNRLTEIDRTQTSAHQERVIERLAEGRGRIPSPYRIWLHSPGLAEGWEVVGRHLDNASALTTAEQEILILAVGVHWNAPYVIENHIRHALKAGLPQAAVDAILARKRPELPDARQQAVHDFVADALAGGSIPDARFAEHNAALGRERIAEMLILIGYFTSVSLGLTMHEMS